MCHVYDCYFVIVAGVRFSCNPRKYDAVIAALRQSTLLSYLHALDFVLNTPVMVVNKALVYREVPTEYPEVGRHVKVEDLPIDLDADFEDGAYLAQILYACVSVARSDLLQLI